jgi:tRNA (guanine37-N1)-methyltransferase
MFTPIIKFKNHPCLFILMIGLKTEKKNGQKIKIELLEKNILDTSFLPLHEDKCIIFPVKSNISDKDLQKIKNTIITQTEFKESKKKLGNLKDIIKTKLSEKEMRMLKTAYDTVGDIAILEIDEELRNKEKIIAETVLKLNNQIKVVLRKEGIHEGVFRTQKMKILAGEKRKETTYTENGVKLKLDVEKVYFSPRLSTERKRINLLVKKDEDVLVMFSGCGVYPINISKNTKAKNIIGIEINPDGHKYALENQKINKLKNITFYCGDVNDVVPKLNQKFDRILMPLPKSAEDFLDLALSVSKKGTIIHFYDFLHENNFDLAKQKINSACKNRNLSYRILDLVKCGQQSPRVFRICVDFEII